MRKISLNTLIALILMVFLFVSAVQAEEPYDLTMCLSGVSNTLLATKELVLYEYQGNGMTMSNHENKKFHGMSYRCIGTVKIEKGVSSGITYCKYMDADGDLVVGEAMRNGEENSWKFLYGTGKWQGIKGGGPAGAPVARGKPISEGTFQVCNRATGNFSLP